MSMLSNSYAQSHVEAIGVKVQLLEDGGGIVDSTRFSLDPEITSFEMLQSILAKAFDIKGEFVIAYLTVDDEEHIVQLSMLNDWDLDAAILNCSSQSCLKLIVQRKRHDDGLSEWDIVERCDIPTDKPSGAGYLNTQDGFVNALTDKLSNILGKKSKAEPNYKSSKSPMTDPEFRKYMDSDGKLIFEREFRESIYQGGIEPSLRKVTWRHLLCVFPPDMNGKQRYEYLQCRAGEYAMLRDKWKGECKNGNPSEELKFITSMVKKDVIRTDRTLPYFKGREDNKNIASLFDLLCTYSINHPDVSYCQGMSDMASVLLVVQNDEANAYLCFCALMKRLKSNFLFDGKAMTCKFDHLKLLLSYYDPEYWTYMIENEVNHLFFTYRWLLLELKREFAFNDSLYMLEVMWSTLPIDTANKDVTLSDLYTLSQDGSHLVPRRQRLAPAINNNSSSSSASNTPTPYVKLLSLCRKSSSQLNTPVVQETAKHVLNDMDVSESACERCEQGIVVLEPEVDATLETELAHLQQEQTSAIPSNEVSTGKLNLNQSADGGLSLDQSAEEIVTEPSSTFYLAVVKDDKGRLHYHTNEDSLGEVTESYDKKSNSNENVSCGSSTDSGIKTHPQTPIDVQSSTSTDLQFAFESSGNQRSLPHRTVFPSPDEFGYGNPFLMFAAFTMILQHRDNIIKNKLDFDSIVMLFDRMVRKNDVHKILHRAKAAYEQYLKHDCQAYDC